jgi:predicted DCC family thiol-disulfide oxidoreductase YuxK
MAQAERVVLFDGVCNFCNAAVNFIIDRDPESLFHFAPLQSDVGKELLRKHGMKVPEGDPDTIVLIDGEHAYERSGAALRIARRLASPWKVMFAFIVVPWFLRDLVYVIIAKNRYRLFGKSDTCRVPTPDVRARFLA